MSKGHVNANIHWHLQITVFAVWFEYGVVLLIDEFMLTLAMWVVLKYES